MESNACFFLVDVLTYIVFSDDFNGLQETPMDVKPVIMEGEFSGIQDEHVLLLSPHLNNFHFPACVIWKPMHTICMQGTPEDPSKTMTEGSSNPSIDLDEEVCPYLSGF